MRIEVRFAGFGGQGIILAGIVLGRAAALYDNMYAVQTQSYGPEARGGASRSEVVISDKEIDYPKVQNPDIFVAMSNEAFSTYINDLKPKGIVIIDSDLVKPSNIRNDVKLFKIPATKLAEKKIGLPIVANMVMVGALTSLTNIVSKKAAKKAIIDSVPPNTEEKNIKAFNEGMKVAKNETVRVQR